MKSKHLIEELKREIKRNEKAESNNGKVIDFHYELEKLIGKRKLKYLYLLTGQGVRRGQLQILSQFAPPFKQEIRKEANAIFLKMIEKLIKRNCPMVGGKPEANHIYREGYKSGLMGLKAQLKGDKNG